MRAFAAAILLWLAATPLLAQETAPEAFPPPILVLEIEAATGSGEVRIELLPEVAPVHVARMLTLTARGAYDDVAFHRVLPGFMAQTGDVEFGRAGAFDRRRVGTGKSALQDLPFEGSDIPFEAGVVAMARGDTLESGNSQFFIMTSRQPRLDGQYTVFGRVVEGMELILTLRTGMPQLGGKVSSPDWLRGTRIE